MNKFWQTFKMTYKIKARSKSFIFVTLAFAIILGAAGNADKIISFFNDSNDDVAVIANDEEIQNYIKMSFEELDDEAKIVETNEEDAKEGILKDKYKYAIKISNEDNTIDVEIIDDENISNNEILKVKTLVSNLQSSLMAERLDLSSEDLNMLVQSGEVNVTSLSNDVKSETEEITGIVISYLALFLNYLLILLYTVQVATDIAVEKSSRVMEVIVSSIKPVHHLFAKILGTLAVALTQLFIWIFVSAVSLYTGLFSRESEGILEGINIKEFLDIKLVATIVIFITLSYLLFASAAALLGSLVNRIEEVSQATAPVTGLSLVGLYIGIYAIIDPGSTFVKISEYIPFITPFTILVRVIMTDVSIAELTIKAMILVISALIMLYLSGKVYKGGVIMYGKGSILNIKKAIKLGK